MEIISREIKYISHVFFSYLRMKNYNTYVLIT
jgi:hypothetical protein